MGPPPKPDSQRRHRGKGLGGGVTVKLPAEGRKGETPRWPLSKCSKAEAALWRELWGTPQAVVWERLAWFRTVARYCRLLVKAEKSDAAGVVLSEVRQLEDRLGLTPMSMLRLRWEVVEDEVAAARGSQDDPRRRLKAVDPNAVAGS